MSKLIFVIGTLLFWIAFVGASSENEALVGHPPPSLHPLARGSHNWILVTEREVNPHQLVNWRIYLKLRNLDELTALTLRIADPESPEYGNLVDLDYINEHFTPLQDQVDRVLAWIEASGTTHTTTYIPPGRQYIRFRSTIQQIETLFNTRFGWYRSLISDLFHLRPVEPYYIPSSLLQDSIDYVDQFSEFPNQPPQSAADAADADSYETANPSVIISKYKVVEPSGPVSGSSSATVQFAPNWYSSTDLQTFFTKYAPKVSGQKVASTFGVNGNAPTTIPSKPSVESNLDQQYIMGIGNFVQSSIYYVVDPVSGGIEEGFVDYATYINNQASFPWVQSISYGQYGGQYTNATVQRLTAELQMAGARGYSGLLASGDNGVGAKCSSGQCTSFEFDFPSSPYLTMIGATQFLASSGTETGATLSAGGFSLDYYTPSWQASAVNGYFKSGVALPPSTLYKSTGRGYPDISAVGQSVEVVVSGASELVGGTSCSAPITAGIFALLNNYRLSNGKSPLGWLNPFIYANPQAFNDITIGNNKYCTISCCCPGFNAAKGWDPVTGLGSPNYPALLNAVKALN